SSMSTSRRRMIRGSTSSHRTGHDGEPLASPTVDDELSSIRRELAEFLNNAIATHAYARGGLLHQRAFFERLPSTPENPDPTVYMGRGDPNENFAPFASWKLSEVKERLAPNGDIERWLGQQWVVSTYAAWEHEFRPRLAQAAELDTGQI